MENKQKSERSITLIAPNYQLTIIRAANNDMSISIFCSQSNEIVTIDILPEDIKYLVRALCALDNYDDKEKS